VPRFYFDVQEGAQVTRDEIGLDLARGIRQMAEEHRAPADA
jgi:hypothetical protein